MGNQNGQNVTWIIALAYGAKVLSSNPSRFPSTNFTTLSLVFFIVVSGMAAVQHGQNVID
jgi:hypothetical protein